MALLSALRAAAGHGARTLGQRPEPGFVPPRGSYVLGAGEQPFVRKPQQIFLTPGLQAGHALVVGQTGSGKSKLLEAICRQMLEAGQGFCLIDLHGDLSRDLQEYVAALPEPRRSAVLERFLWVDVADPHRVAPFNPLAAASPEESATVVLELIAGLRRHWSEFWGPRMEDLLTQALGVIQAGGLTLAEVPLFLGDETVRAKLLEHPAVSGVQRDYFRLRYDALSKRDRITMSESTLNKFGALLSDPRMATFLGSREEGLSPRRALARGEFVLVRIPRGALVENANVVGSLVLAAFHTAALARVDLPVRRRRPYVLVIDEAQIASETFPQLLAGARAFGLSAISGVQFLDALPGNLAEALLANCRVRAAFRLSRRDGERLARELFRADGDHVKYQEHDLLGSRRSRPMYWSVPEEWEYRIRALQDQRVGQFVLQLDRGLPWFAETFPVEAARPGDGDRAKVAAHIAHRTRTRASLAAETQSRRLDLTTETSKGGDPHDSTDPDDAVVPLAEDA